jgi:hypothetical protein
MMIRSLESKLKRLEEERDKSIPGEDDTPAVKEEEAEEDGAKDDDLVREDRVSGGESRRSCKESNSTDLKRPGHDAATASAASEADTVAREKEDTAGGESVAGSKEADTEKESNDMQSTASPSRRREWRRRGGIAVNIGPPYGGG